MLNENSSSKVNIDQIINQKIEELGDWRGKKLSQIRNLVLKTLPEAREELKWRGTLTWYYNGMLFTCEIYKSIVKMTFAKGAILNDSNHLFNSSLEGNTRRAIDFKETDEIDEEKLADLISKAAMLNNNK